MIVPGDETQMRKLILLLQEGLNLLFAASLAQRRTTCVDGCKTTKRHRYFDIAVCIELDWFSIISRSYL